MPLMRNEQFALTVRAPVLRVVMPAAYARACPDLLEDWLALSYVILSERYPLPEGD